MSTYRFVGVSACIGSRELTQFGQKILLTDEQYATAVAGGAALISDEKFQEIGFTDDELRRYAFTGSWSRATSEFQEKRAAAVAALYEIRRAK